MTLVYGKMVPWRHVELITLILIQQSSFSSTFPNKIIFFDYSTKSQGRQSFINKSKRISELISFPRHNLLKDAFMKRLEESVLIYMR